MGQQLRDEIRACGGRASVVQRLEYAGAGLPLALGHRPTATECQQGGKPNSRVTSRHFDHSSASRAFMSRSNRPWFTVILD